MLARALPAATPSSISPIRNSKTTVAASSVAPIKAAPTAAIVISISIEKGVPDRAAMIARRATGSRPTSIAATNAHRSTPGTAFPMTNAITKAKPQASVSWLLRDFHQGVPTSGFPPEWLTVF